MGPKAQVGTPEEPIRGLSCLTASGRPLRVGRSWWLSPKMRESPDTANMRKATWLLLNLDDQESAGVEPSTRREPPTFSGALPLALIAADQATRPMLSAGVVFPEPSCPWTETASARLSKSHDPLHIPALSVSH